MNCQTTSNPVTARLRAFAMISLMLGASLAAHAQSGGVIEQDCGVNPDDQEHEVFLFFARYGVFLQQSPSQVMPDPRGMDLSSGDGIVSLPFAASLIFIPGTNSVIEPLLRHGEVVETSPESEFGALMKDFAFETEAALTTRFPAGIYSAEYKSDGLSISVSRTLEAFNVPTPTIENFDELQSFPRGQAFTIRWLPFGNSNPQDSVIALRLEEIDARGDFVKTVFIAPDYCKKIFLQSTDVAITVPADIVQPGTRYQGELSFSRTGTAEKTTVPSLYLEALDSKQTRFPVGGVVSPGGNEAPTRVRSIVPAGPGKFILTVNTPGAIKVRVQTSVDLKTWTLHAELVAGPNGVTSFDLTPLALETSRFYRAWSVQ